MTASIPPSPRRRAAARAAGLRPRSRLWVLGGVAAGLAVALARGWSRAVAWLDSRLAAAVAGTELEPSAAVAAVVGLLALVVAAVGVCALTRPRPGGHEPGLDEDLDEISGGLRLAMGVAALALVLGSVRGVAASAARAVDVGIEPGALAGLATVWQAWVGRTLTALAVVALGLGVIERLASARRLWQGLHLTPAEARDRARARSRRSP